MALDRNTIQIKTLTPLWTGDVKGECNEVKETGIIGSLRWWYEALVRGLGGYACDPTNSDCKFNYKEYKRTGKIQDGLRDMCDACYLFGCTGWSRRFLLEIGNGNPVYKGTLKVKCDRRGWYLKGGLYDSLNARILNTSQEDRQDTVREDYRAIVISLLEFISRWGAIGAKTQQGYGVFSLNPSETGLSETELPRVLTNGSRKRISEQKHLPHIEEIFVWKVNFRNFEVKSIPQWGNFTYNRGIDDDMSIGPDILQFLYSKYDFVPTSPLFRYRLRKSLKQSFNNSDLRHFMMGFMGIGGSPRLRMEREVYEKMGSKIHVSHLYKKGDLHEMRIWAWIPKYVLLNSNGRVRLFEKHFRTSTNSILNTLSGEIRKSAEEIFAVENPSVVCWNFDVAQKRVVKVEIPENESYQETGELK
ncbi:MAG: type III-B CRISPR module RAMP protein Cmr1 [Candidatus Methanofastidiosia archaeon]